MTLAGALALALGAETGGCQARLSPAESPDGWGRFAAFPGARVLCRQHVTGAGPGAAHINWTLYATDRPASEVRAFYAGHAGRQDAAAPAEVEISLGKARLSAYPAAAPSYPRCGVEPKATDKTAIVVSYMARPAE